MQFEISYSKRFRKHYKKLHEFEKRQVKNKVELLAKNPFHPSLRTKHVKGTEDLLECSVNMDIRILWCYEDNSITIILDIGHHDIVK